MNNHSDSLICQPTIYTIDQNISRRDFESIKSSLPHSNVIDQIISQLIDLIKLENPEGKISKEFIDSEVAKRIGSRQIDDYGVWVFYPWSQKLVHCLSEEDFVKVRTIRNKYKIQQSHQDILKEKVVGIVGLSVGQSAALTLAMERVCGEIRIADFDILELSNLNRIRTGIANIGLPKTVVVAREIAEIDPFIKVTPFHEGITIDNVNTFFDADGGIDLLIEECDSVEYKVLLRKEAKRRRVPVVMDTSDRGMLDIERFDTTPEYPIFHNKIDSEIDFEFLKSLKTSEDKLPYILPILDIHSVSDDFKASGLEVGKTLTTWPQLASDVALGGALCCNVTRRILLGDNLISDRYYADLNQIIPEIQNDTRAEIDLDEGILDREEVAEYVRLLDQSPIDSVDKSTLNEILGDAIKASSPGNSQKWLWAFHNNVIHLFVDKRNNLGFADNFNFGSLIGLGCAVENLRLSAMVKGFEIVIAWQRKLNEFNHALSIAFKKNPLKAEQYELYSEINKRHCNRNHCDYSPLTALEISDLSLHSPEGTRLQLITERNAVNSIGDLVCKGDRIRLTNIYGHQDFFKNEIRWSREESIAKGDGLDITLFNLSELDKLGLELSKDISVIERLNKFGGGKGFERISEKAFIGASAIGVIWVKDYSLRNLVEAGSFIERVWLQATKLGIGFQPYTVLQMLFTRLHSDQQNYLSQAQREEVFELKKCFDEITGHKSADESVFLFRLNKANIPIDASYRKSLSEKLIVI